MDLQSRSYLKDGDFDADEVRAILDLATTLRQEKRERRERRRLEGKHVALIFVKTSTRTRLAFEVGARDQGAHTTYLGPGESQLGTKESVADTARVLGRMVDGIEFRGFAHADVEGIAAHAGVPVWNGLTDEWHPTQSLADMLTIQDHVDRPLGDVSVCFVGDGAGNVCASLVTTGALLGMDVRVASPTTRRPSEAAWSAATAFAAASGGRVSATDDPKEAVEGADIVYTDVWVSLGEPDSLWDERIDLLLPYQVNAALMAASGNPAVQFLHCLPAFHDAGTDIGGRIRARRGLEAMEVDDEVFESSASLVFDQAENRLHTIKALMVATLAGLDG